MYAAFVEATFPTAPRQAVVAGPTGTVASLPVDVGNPERQQALIAAIAGRRDEAAFIALHRHFAPRLKAYMKKLGTSDELGEELAQDVLFTVWRKANTYDPSKSAVSSWIFTIARNQRIDTLRRERRRAFDVTDPQLAPTPLPAPDANLQAVQQQRRVQQALGALPRDQAAVVSLAFIQGKSHGEIATYLEIPLGTVKSRIRLAFQRIRDNLGDTADAPIQAIAA